MARNNIKIAALQETKLRPTHRLQSSSSYNLLRSDRSRNYGGGLAFIIHRSVNYRPLSFSAHQDEFAEVQGIAVRSGDNEIEILNIYIPPVSACDPGYTPNIQHLLEGDFRIVLGDFNAHHSSWHSSLRNDARGTSISEQIDETDFCPINEPHPTRITPNCSSSPDITLVSSQLISFTTWQAVTALNSDHLPLIIEFVRNADFVTSEERTYINFSKADLDSFTECTEEMCARLAPPLSANKGENIFRKMLLKVMLKHLGPIGIKYLCDVFS